MAGQVRGRRSGRFHALVLAGGRGTRFWPKSRTKTPKQLLTFLGEGTLLQETVERIRPLIPVERTWVLTNRHLLDAIRNQLPEVPLRHILAEPAQRNTAPCLGMAAHLIAREDPDALLGVFPADHHIARPERFRGFVRAALAAAREGKLVTLGIRPQWPETGYGYLEFPEGIEAGSLEAARVRRFREKPDLATARRFLKRGRFYWNSGMFFWRASAFVEALREFLPRTSALIEQLPGAGERGFGRALERIYPQCENISVDYGVMEKAAARGRVSGVPADDIGWNDLGSWNAVYELARRDGAGNAPRSEALIEDAEGCYIEAPGKMVALLGVRNLVVVDTPDALLIADRSRAQDVGRIVKRLEGGRRHELL